MADDPQPEDPLGPQRRPEPGATSGPGDLFGGLVDLSQMDMAQMMRMLQSEGPVNWEIARQVAGLAAREGETTTEPPVPPATREELDALVRAAEGLVAEATGLAAALGVPTSAVGRSEWAALHLEALRPVLEQLAITMRGALEAGELHDDLPQPHPSLGPLAAFSGDPFSGMLTMLAPVLLGVQAGSMVGYLAQHALGRYDLPLPTSDAPSVVFVVPNIEAFEQSWSLDRRDFRFYVALHEVVRAAERAVPWVQERLVRMATEYVSGYELDLGAFEARFGAIDPSDPGAIAGLAEQPEALLGAMQSDAQRATLTRIQHFTMVIEGYAALVLEEVGSRMIGDFSRVHEAMRRHHVERGEAERFIEGLLGLRLDREHYERGEAFCRGVVERAGLAGLNRLWGHEEMLPTPAELDAPGLWLARIDLPSTDG